MRHLVQNFARLFRHKDHEYNHFHLESIDRLVSAFKLCVPLEQPY